MKTFQPMPDLSEDQYAALRDDIAVNGVIVPIVVDQNGRLLDGHNRRRIAADLGIDCPTEIRQVADDDEAMRVAVTLNCARRHLTREQVREVIRGELERHPGDSDRAIAKRVGCSPSTVGAVRKPAEAVSNLDVPQMSQVEAEKVTEDIRQAILTARGAVYSLVGQALVNGVTVPEVVGALTMARMSFARRPGADPDLNLLWCKLVFDYVAEVTTWPESVERFPVSPLADPTPAERAWLIESIVMMGADEHPADYPRTDDV